MQIKKYSKLLLSLVASISLVGCVGNSSDDYNGDIFNGHTRKNITANEIYEMMSTMAETNTFRQVVYGTYDTFTFTYNADRYIAQEGGDLNYSAICIPSYKADENFNRAYMARYVKDSKGNKTYSLGEALYLYDMYTGEAIGPEKSLLQYSPTYSYYDYTIKGDELKESTDYENTFVMNYNQKWYVTGTGYDTFYFYVANLIEAGDYCGAGRLKKIELSYTSKKALHIVGYINDLETNEIKPFFCSEFYDIGTAKDKYLENFLASDGVKISNEAVNPNDANNILGEELSTTTEIYSIIDGKKKLEGYNYLDYDNEHAHVYGLDGDSYYSNNNGRLYEQYIDGKNGLGNYNTGFPYSQINGLKDRIDFDDFRKVSDNTYRYYGYNYFETFADLSETGIPGSFVITDLYMVLNESGVEKYIAKTNTLSYFTDYEETETIDVSYELVTYVKEFRGVNVLRPYDRKDDEAIRLEKAFEVLNNGEVEFKVHGEEHSDDPDLNNTSVREVIYSKDYVYEDFTYYKSHLDASGHASYDKHNEKTGTFLNRDNMGNPIGTTTFELNDEGNPIATHHMSTSRKNLKNLWYSITPSAEVFDYNPDTRTYTTKRGVGYYAAIFVTKAFKASADNYMDEVRIILNEDLTKIEAVEYDMKWNYGDSYGLATGRLDFDYNVNTSELKAKLENMADYIEPAKWSECAAGEVIKKEFNDYYRGCKDCHGNALDIDMVPYIYDQRAEDYWVPLQMTSFNPPILILVNDAGPGNLNYVEDIVALLEADPDFTAKGTDKNGGKVFENGDMTLSVLPMLNKPGFWDGIWFSKTVK